MPHICLHSLPYTNCNFTGKETQVTHVVLPVAAASEATAKLIQVEWVSNNCADRTLHILSIFVVLARHTAHLYFGLDVYDQLSQ